LFLRDHDNCGSLSLSLSLSLVPPTTRTSRLVNEFVVFIIYLLIFFLLPLPTDGPKRGQWIPFGELAGCQWNVLPPFWKPSRTVSLHWIGCAQSLAIVKTD